MIAKEGYFARFECREATHKVIKRVSEGGPGRIKSWADLTEDDYREVTSWICYHVEVCDRCGKILMNHNRDENKFPCPSKNPSE